MEVKSTEYIDYLTGIYNEKYLKEQYYRYLLQYPNANFIMIDFKKFKSINDTFGHNVGDDYLKIFGKILFNNFPESIVVRLHGDEFAILTKFDEDNITVRFQLCELKISMEVEEGKLPRVFNFNAGSAKAQFDLEETKNVADFMMYSAKQNNVSFQKFDQSIYDKKLNQDIYIDFIDEAIRNDSFSYVGQKLFEKDKNEASILQICTKSENGEPIFDKGRYNLLKNTSILTKFDIYNVQNLLENFVVPNCPIMINIDFKSLLLTSELLNSLKLLKDIVKQDFTNIILSINLNGITTTNYKDMICKISELMSLGFKICLDKYDSHIADIIWEDSNISYIKLISSYWKQAMDNERMRRILKYRINMFNDILIQPIFDCVTNEREYDFLYNISSGNILLGGDYYGEGAQFILTRKQ